MTQSKHAPYGIRICIYSIAEKIVMAQMNYMRYPANCTYSTSTAHWVTHSRNLRQVMCEMMYSAACIEQCFSVAALSQRLQSL